MKINVSLYSTALALAFCLMGMGSAFAQSFEVDGMRFAVLSATQKTVTVEDYHNSLEPSDYIDFDNTPAVPDARPRMAAGVEFYDVEIPSSVSFKGEDYTVVAIADGAFSHLARMAKIVIPSTVNAVGAHAFDGCVSLTTIHNHSDKPQQVGMDAFKGVDRNANLTVPAWSLAQYAGAEVWQDFVNVYYFKIDISDVTALIARYLAQDSGIEGSDKIAIDDITGLIRLYLNQTY